MMKQFKLSSLALVMLGLCASHVVLAEDHTQIIAVPDQQSKIHWFSRDVSNQIQLLSHAKHPLLKLNKKFQFAPFPLEDVKAGGIGGNEKTGFIYYDGLSGAGHADALSIQRNPLTKTCYLQNNDIIVRDWNHDLDVVEFPCSQPDPKHNNLYWNPNFDYANGAYNPAVDAFFAAQVATHMYTYDYQQPVWNKAHTQTPITIFIHANDTYFNEGGFFSDGSDPWYVSLSDGDNKTYPATTLDIVSDYISVGTALSYWGYSWGIGNSPSIAQSYSDAFAKAVEFSATGTNDWTIGSKFVKGRYGALRYMDEPGRDCPFGHKHGEACSIETYAEYKDHPYIEPEYGAGLLNKVFYTIATTPGWDTKQAFQILNHATAYLFDRDWNPDSGQPPDDNFTFKGTFCALISSAKDYNYSQDKINDIKKALTKVGMDVSLCTDTVAKQVRKKKA